MDNLHQTTIDQLGRIELPRPMRDALGLNPGVLVVVELTAHRISIRQAAQAGNSQTTPLTQRVAQMELPVASWDEMEREIEGEHLR